MEMSFQNLHILVFGDVMLDEYIYGDVVRISPEAPIPVVRVSRRKTFLGGAANVAAGIKALGAQATLVGAVGEDANAAEFKALTENYGVLFAGASFENRKTTVKTRVVGNSRQIVRYDDEIYNQPGNQETELIFELLLSNLSSADAFVISDYAKGVCGADICSRIIQAAKKAGKPVIADPKTPDWSKFRGADVVAPNFEEFKATLNMPGLENCEEAICGHAQMLAEKYDLGGILVTRSMHGMTFIPRCGEAFTETAAVREVFDVSGAGDTVVAALSVFCAAKANIETAVSMANTAAGIAVSKRGTHTVTFEELLSAVERKQTPKLCSLEMLDKQVAAWKEENKIIVFTNGCFDILHSGHITLLETARLEGDVLVLGINSDSSVKMLKGKGRPINNENDRAFVLASLTCVDAVVMFHNDTPLELIRRIKPDVIVKGGDYSEETVVGADFIKSYGGNVLIVPLVESMSTSSIVNRIRE